MNRTATFVMTRERTWVLTAVSVLLFILLCGIFADGLLTPPLWKGDSWIASPLITYLLILAIVLAGWSQARSIPERGIALQLESTPMTPRKINDPVGWRLLIG